MYLYLKKEKHYSRLRLLQIARNTTILQYYFNIISANI